MGVAFAPTPLSDSHNRPYSRDLQRRLLHQERLDAAAAFRSFATAAVAVAVLAAVSAVCIVPLLFAHSQFLYAQLHDDVEYCLQKTATLSVRLETLGGIRRSRIREWPHGDSNPVESHRATETEWPQNNQQSSRSHPETTEAPEFAETEPPDSQFPNPDPIDEEPEDLEDPEMRRSRRSAQRRRSADPGEWDEHIRNGNALKRRPQPPGIADEFSRARPEVAAPSPSPQTAAVDEFVMRRRFRPADEEEPDARPANSPDYPNRRSNTESHQSGYGESNYGNEKPKTNYNGNPNYGEKSYPAERPKYGTERNNEKPPYGSERPPNYGAAERPPYQTSTGNYNSNPSGYGHNSPAYAATTQRTPEYRQNYNVVPKPSQRYGRPATAPPADQCCSCGMGAAGPPGPPGRPGPPGLDGKPGRHGRNGPDAAPNDHPTAGDFCFDCPRAPTGAPGPPGIKGPPGEPAMPGDEGPTPPRGPPGSVGPIGAPGPPGTPGRAGEPGRSGVLRTIEGAPGPAGARGADGQVGAPGPPGAPGRAGKPGASGPKGEGGLPGADGLPGAAGRAGKRGTRGSKGDCSHCPQPRTPPGY